MSHLSDLLSFLDAVAKLVSEGMELGHADNVVFNKTNSKQETGSVGNLTYDLLTREEYYYHALVLALIPFIQPSLF